MEPSSKRQRTHVTTTVEAATAASHGLALMLTDVEEESSGTILLWGVGQAQQTVLVVVPDYQPYFYLPCPFKTDSGGQNPHDPCEQDIVWLRQQLNARLSPESHIESMELCRCAPIMYYRPDAPAGTPFLKCSLKTGASVKRVSGAVEKLVSGGGLAAAGFSWRQRGTQPHEGEVKLLTRFLCDTSLSGGSWLWVCPAQAAPQTPNTAVPQQQQPSGSSAAAGVAVEHSRVEPGLFEYVSADSPRRRSSCAVEVVVGWRCLHSLTPDATQLAQQDWTPQVMLQLQPPPKELQTAAAAAAAGDILPLKMLVLDVLLAPADGSNRSANPEKDPIITITCQLSSTGSSSSSSSSDTNSSSSSSSTAGLRAPTKVAFVLASPAAAAALPAVTAAEGFQLQLCATEASLLLAWRGWVRQVDPDGFVVFQVRDNLGALATRFQSLNLDGGSCHISRALQQHSKGLASKSVVMYSVAWVKSQSRMASTSNQETFRAEGMAGRVVLDVLRQVLTSQSLATFSLVDCCHSLLNQTLEVLPGHRLAALQQQLAHTPQAKARDRPGTALDLAPAGPAESSGAGGTTPAGTSSKPQLGAQGVVVSSDQVPGVRAGLRLARYSLRRCAAVSALMERLASVPETFEMARATGLTLNQVLYNAQMIRTWSLLLRTSHRRGFIIAGRMQSETLVESPHLMHPIEHRTAGLYNTPVATLDFASLYPSLYRAYNLCYTTLVHPDDISKVGADKCSTTPTGAAFLQPSVRAGILPDILQALMSARSTTRAALKTVQKQLQQQHSSTSPAVSAVTGVGGSSSGPGHHDSRHAAAELSQHLRARAAVLDGRQKALKVTANALYGFTGAQASPLQCAPLADSCLALGAATCRSAAAAISEALDKQQLGPKGQGGKVIYAQTDSVFINFPSATAAEAVELGQAAAALVTAELPPPIELKYERVMAPFMLLHVNRYAGCSYETAAAAASGNGSLLVKGIKAIWRQSAPLLQNTLMGVLERILMQRDVPGAVSFAEGQIARLLSGRVEMWELAMTGGLWRVTGQQLAAAAAADADEEGPGSQSVAAAASAAAAAGGGDEVKGPHASLAVRLSQRDPDKKWLLGERLSYVLLTGARTQDEAAEDPLTATQLNLTPNFALYWTNKFQIPLQEILSTCLNPEQMRHLLHGPHTNFRASTTAGSDLPPEEPEHGLLLGGLNTLGSQSAAAGAGVTAHSQATPGQGGCRGRGRGRGGRGRGGRGSSTAAAVSPAGKKSATSLASKQRGQGLKMFFQQTAKCLSCKQVIHTRPQQGSQGTVEPGLCDDCAKEDGKRESVFISVVHEASDAAERFSAAHSSCRHCHSGGQLGAVVCENGECPVAYERVASERLVRIADHKLLRLEW